MHQLCINDVQTMKSVDVAPSPGVKYSEPLGSRAIIPEVRSTSPLGLPNNNGCRHPLARSRSYNTRIPHHQRHEVTMKTGMNLLLWTTHVTAEHFPLFAKLKAAGFDGVEIPLF